MRRLPALFLLPLLLLLGASAPPTAAAAARVSASTHLPAVSGGFGTKPRITFPDSAPPKRLEVEVLHQGTGAKLPKGNLLVCNYLGQIWRGKVFSTSFGSGLFASLVGENKLIKAWDQALPGLRVGSRVELVVPPADGYGKKGSPQAGITGKDTLVFVIDLVAAYSPGVHGDPHATVLRRVVNGVHVGGPLGGIATVSVKGAPKPKKISVTLIARGHGPKVAPGLVIDQYVVATWSGPTPPSTWGAKTPDAETVGNKATPSVLDPLVGMPLGSRVLVEVPATPQGGPYAFVFDLVAEPKA